MKLISKKLPKNHNIFLFGDLHIGTIFCHRDGIQQLISMMQRSYCKCKNNYGICMGDMIEAITIDDKRYDEATTREPYPLLQVKDAVETLWPIRKKLITVLKGNHEHKLWKFGNLAQEIANQLGVEYGTWSSKVTIYDTNNSIMYKIFVTHGNRALNSSADSPRRRRSNQELMLQRNLQFLAGDTIIMAAGHSHKLLICKPEKELYLTDNGKKIIQNYISSSMNDSYIHPDQRYYVSTGSFLKLYIENHDGYAERLGCYPVQLGFAVVKVREGRIEGVDKIVV